MRRSVALGVVLAVAVGISALVGLTLTPSASALAGAPPPALPDIAPVDNPAYAGELEKWLAGDGAYAGEADSWISGRVLAGDGASIADYFTAAESAEVGLGWGAALAEVAAPVLLAAGATYLTYKLVEHLRNGHTVTRTFKVPASTIGGAAASSVDPQSCFQGSTGVGCSFWLASADSAQWKINALGNYVLTFPRTTVPGAAAATVADPAVCGGSDLGQLQRCFGGVGNPITSCAAPLFPCTYLDLPGLMAVAASNAAAWHYFHDFPIGSFQLVPSIFWHNCSSVAVGTCNAHERQATPEQLGHALQTQAVPAAVPGTPTITKTITQPNAVPNLDPARHIIDNNPALRDHVNSVLEEAHPGTITIPECAGMTYANCLLVLHAAGELGPVTQTLEEAAACIAQCDGKVTTTNPLSGSVVLPDESVQVRVEPMNDVLVLPAPTGTQTPAEYFDTVVTANPTLRPLPQPYPTEDVGTEPWSNPTAQPCAVEAVYGGDGATYDPLPIGGGSHTVLNPDGAIDVLLHPHATGQPACGTDFNPDLDPPVGTDTGGGDTGGVPPLDLGPIKGVNVCDKFPVGIFCWAKNILGAFNAAPVAPVFDFHLAAWGGTHFRVDLAILDDYMRRIRELLTFVIWIGAVWWVGTRLLGFKASGDPGAAMDDGFEL